VINSLGDWSLQVCAVSVIAALWDMLFPDLKKYGVFSLMRIVMLLCVIRLFLPVLDSGDIDIFSTKSSFSESEAQDIYVSEFSDALSNELLRNIKGLGINVQDVRIDISVTEDGYSIDGIGVIPAPNADLTADAAELSKEWEIPVYVLKTEGGT